MSSPATTTSNTASFKQFVQIWSMLKGWGPLPQFHKDICDWLSSTDVLARRCLQAYRWSGKSHLVCLYVAWRLYCRPEWTCVIVSGTERLAIERSDFIRKIIEEHPLTGHLVNTKEKWRSEKFTVKRESASIEPSVVIRSLGGSVTGLHGELLIGDDLETMDNSITAEQQQKIRDYIAELLVAFDNHLYVGTPHAPADETMFDLLGSDASFEMYKRPVWDDYGKDTQRPAWPERHDADWIRAKETAPGMTSGKFKSQYLLVPSRSSETLMSASMVVQYTDALFLDPIRQDRSNSMRGPMPIYWINNERVTDLRAYWDIASGLRGRDNSVVAVCAKTDRNHIYIVDLVKLPPIDLGLQQRFEPQMIVVLDALKRNYCNAIYVETTNINNIASDLKAYASDKGYRVKVNETTRVSTQNKERFIAEVLEPLIKANRLHALPWMLDRRQCEFVSELEKFPHGKHDDHLDAVAGAVNELEPRRVQVGMNAARLNNRPLRQARTMVVNKYQPFAS